MLEKEARKNIDELLQEAGFKLISFGEFKAYFALKLDANAHLAVREFELENGGRADYLLFVAGKVCGVLEAKSPQISLSGAENQAKNYAKNLPSNIPSFENGVRFLYQSNGSELYFTDLTEARARKIFAFHTPQELLDKFKIPDTLRQRLAKLPFLSQDECKKLRTCQKEAIENLEKSLKANKQRALIHMATGAGKTFTACNFVYRLLNIAKAKRILFLVDRNNLGTQAKEAFDKFTPSDSSLNFSQIYNVTHLQTNLIPPESKLVITTIQRLYSLLCGESEFDSTNEENSSFESENLKAQKPKLVPYNANIGIDSFDFIIIDECHRSIYGLWRQVLEYFDAFLIGLSATPSTHTFGFFAQNAISSYTLEHSILDKVNVGYEVFRIKTHISENGSVIKADSEFCVPFRDKDTRKTFYEELEEDLEYSKNELDRSVLAPHQIRTILQTYKDKVFAELYPEREPSYSPKTLIFAKDDNHAEEITRIAREVFNQSNEFAQKITYNIGNQKPKELINDFKNSKKFRIAVTVDMIATGTDIKPLEVLIFMRDIKSQSYYEQMIGRGTRSINDDDLRAVTPNASCKTHFYIIDAVGVSESQKINSRPLERKKSLSLKELIERVKEALQSGDYSKDELLSLASRLIRLELKLSKEDEELLQKISGKALNTLASEIITFADTLPQSAENSYNPLVIFNNDDFVNLLLKMAQKGKIYIDELSKDTLISAEFDEKKAHELLLKFSDFLLQNRDEITALSIIYSKDYQNRHLTYELIKELENKLKTASMDTLSLWNAYRVRDKSKVAQNPSKSLTNLICLVRYALGFDERLEDFTSLARSRYNLWRGRCLKNGINFSKEQEEFLELIKEYIIANGCVKINEIQGEIQSICEDLGGIFRAKALFKEDLPKLIEELNLALVG